jgi:hypothetical protein
LTSLDLMKTGMSFGANWRASANQFLYKPQEAMRDFYLPQAQMSMQLAESQYNSENNIARAAAMPDPQVTGAANDALTLGALEAQSTQNMANALAGLGTAAAGAYSSFNSPAAAQSATPSWQRNARTAPAAYGY